MFKFILKLFAKQKYTYLYQFIIATENDIRHVKSRSIIMQQTLFNKLISVERINMDGRKVIENKTFDTIPAKSSNQYTMYNIVWPSPVDAKSLHFDQKFALDLVRGKLRDDATEIQKNLEVINLVKKETYLHLHGENYFPINPWH